MNTMSIAVETYAEIDLAARFLLRMSGEDFIQRWCNGGFKEPDETPGVMEVASLLPPDLR